MALPADWVDFGGGQIYRQTQDGFAPVSQDELDAYQYQTQNQGRDPQAQADYQYTQKSIGALDGVQMLTPEQQAAVNAGTFTPPAGMGVYNAGNGVQVLVPLGDPRFIAAPQHNDSFATFPSGIVGTTLTHIQDTRNAYQKNPERLLQGGGPADTPIGTALTNSALGTNYAPTVNQTGGPTQQTYDNAAAAGYQTGPTETGHTLAPAIVGIGLAGGLVSGAEGAGTLAGTSDAAALTGTAAGDTAIGGSGFVGDIPLAGEGGTSIYGAGSGAGSGGSMAEGDWWDFGNQYADSTFQGGQPDLTNYGDTSPSMLQQAKDLAKQAGITPQSALNYLKQAIGRGAPAVLGAVAANRQADSLADLAKQYMDLGAPSRARYESSFDPNFTMANDAGYMDSLNQTSKASMHALSVNGNPAGSPNAWGRTMQDVYEKTAYPALQNYRNTNANAGGIASLQTAAPGAATGAITAQGNVFNAVGAGANDIFNPKPSLAETLAQYKRLMSAP